MLFHIVVSLLVFLPSTFLLSQDICVRNNCLNRSSEGDKNNCSCFTSLKIFEDPLKTSDIDITFSNGSYTLDFCWKIVDISLVRVQKEDINSKVTIVCQEEGTLFVQNTTELTIAGLDFINCSGGQLSISIEGYSFSHSVRPALSIWFGYNLSLINVTVEDSITGLCVIDVGGTVRLDNVEITRHKNLDYNNYFAGNLFLHRNFTVVETVVIISQLKISNFGFVNDFSLDKDIIIQPSGLTIFVNSSKVSYTVDNSVFSNNTGKFGGSLSLLLGTLKETEEEYVITLSRVTICKGKAVYGGGLFISFQASFWRLHNDNASKHIRAIKIANSSFLYNHANANGGGLYIQWDQSLKFALSYSALVIDSNFNSNSVSSNGGLGLHCKAYINSGLGRSELCINITVVKCNFSGHAVDYKTQPETETGVLFANSADNLTLKSVDISKNNASGIFLIDSKVTFTGKSFITFNRALLGGGINLCSKSLLNMNDNTELLILNNSAETVGGGIIINDKCPSEKPVCFYQFYRKTFNSISIKVHSNTARIAGNNIFGGSIATCYFYLVKSKHAEKQRRVLDVPFNNATDLSSVSSNPQHVCLVNGMDFYCLKRINISAFPGEKVTIKVRVVGQKEGSVPGMVHLKTSGNVKLLNSEDKPYNIPPSYKELNFKIARASNKLSSNNNSISLQVGVGTNFVIFTEYSRVPPPKLYIDFIKCPLGFSLQSKKGSYICDCIQYFRNVNDCKLVKQSGLIVKKANAWIGHEQFDGKMSYISGDCPLDYCDENYVEVELEDGQDFQCKYNRSGIMCGVCRQGWSMMFGSYQCSNSCSNITLLLVFPFLLVGLLLFIVISCLDLTITNGIINGAIFYANILQTFQSDALDKHPVKVLTSAIKTFLSWFNMDLGVPTCFFEGMAMFSKVLLGGAFPLYIWLIAFTVILLSNRNVRITRFLGKNPVHVVATLILLTYSKMLRVALSALRYTEIHVFDDRVYPKRVWYLDGTVAYLRSSKHIILVTIAILFVTLTLPFTISLLCIKYIFKLSNYSRFFSFIDKLKPFFDAYTGPFKDRARFWPGLLLLVRIIVLLITIAPNNHSYYVVNLVIIFLLSLIVSLNGIYKKRILDALEVFFLLNLAVILATTERSKLLCQHCSKVVINSSLFIYIVVVIVIIGYHVILKLSQMKCLHVRITRSLQMRPAFDVSHVIRQRSEESLESCREDESPSDIDKLVNFSN